MGVLAGPCRPSCVLARPGPAHLSKELVVGSAIGPMRRDNGVALHRELGRRTDHLRGAEAGSRAARAVAVGLIILAVALLLLMLVARSPSAWAAGLEGAGAQNRGPA